MFWRSAGLHNEIETSIRSGVCTAELTETKIILEVYVNQFSNDVAGLAMSKAIGRFRGVLKQACDWLALAVAGKSALMLPITPAARYAKLSGFSIERLMQKVYGIYRESYTKISANLIFHDESLLGHINRGNKGRLNKAIISSRALGGLRGVAAFLLLSSLCQLGRADELVGGKTYSYSCAACHGAGDGVAGFAPDLSRFKGDETAFLSVVKNGRPGTIMPRWEGVITEPEMISIWAYLKQRSPIDVNAKANEYAFQESGSEKR